MPPCRPAVPITLAEAERIQLLGITRCRSLPRGVVQWAQVTLA